MPRPLFEAAVRVLRGQFVESYNLWLLAQFRAGTDPQLTTARKLAVFFGATERDLWPVLWVG